MPRPVLVTTWPFGAPANQNAWPALAAGGDPLDAACAVCRHVEEDEAVDSVGYGGLPDAGGRVSLDACVMRSPLEKGAVAVLRACREAVTAARFVMERTPHAMLAGADADAFARECGLTADELLAPSARAKWEERASATHTHDTVTALALGADGRLAGACSTSGRAWKLPGRVGDSPIFGHGLYVEPGVGAAGATGEGELVMGCCSSFLVVEELRRGAPPEDAIATALARLVSTCRAELEEPSTQVALLALTADGRWAHGAVREGYATAVVDAEGSRVVPAGGGLLT